MTDRHVRAREMLEEALLLLEGERSLGISFRMSDLPGLREEVAVCRLCQLCETRRQTVFGEGSPHADLMFIGEAPGAEEDRQGVPFVGRAGELLTKMIQAMGLTRDQVFIANVLKCRPPGNRDPETDEIESCRPYLLEQIRLIRPLVLCTLGAFAARTVIGSTASLSRLRGRSHLVEGTVVIPTFHPAYLLRQPRDKALAWEDLKHVMRELQKKKGP
jgi:DNA polymerase